MPDTSTQQIRESVLQAARHIEELSNSNAPPESVLPKFLELLVTALGAPAGAVWMLDEQRRLGLACDVRLSESGATESAEWNQHNRPLLENVITSGQATAYSPDDASVRLPSSHLIILVALQTGNDCVGAVELFQRADAPPEARPGYLQFAEQMCGYVSQYLERQQQSGAVEVSDKFWQDLEQLNLNLQRSLETSVVAGTIANDGRLLLGCDRLSVAVKRGSKTKIVAISGQDSVNARANLVRTMGRLTSRVIATRETVSFTGRAENLPRQIEKPLADYVQESGSRMVSVVPLFRPEPLSVRDDDSQESARAKPRREVIGGLVIEQVSESQPLPGLQEKVDVLADHSAAALANAREFQRVFLLPLWRGMGRVSEWFYGRKLAKLVAALAVVSAVVSALVLIQWEYRVEGEGRLMPVDQRQVFVPWDGVVKQIDVTDGQRVNAGDLLIQLHNDDLEAQLHATRNEKVEKQQLLVALRAEIAEAVRTADRDEESRLEGQLSATNVEIVGLDEQGRILEDRLSQLTIRAPITGTVATFQIEQLLRNRPVNRGEVLVEVIDDTGDWQLELEVEEHRMGHIIRAQEQQQTEELPVEFILATTTEVTFPGRLERVATRAATSTERGSVVELFVSIDAADLPENSRRIGAEVRAKISCGQRSLGYVLFGDVVEFIQKHLWL